MTDTVPVEMRYQGGIPLAILNVLTEHNATITVSCNLSFGVVCLLLSCSPSGTEIMLMAFDEPWAVRSDGTVVAYLAARGEDDLEAFRAAQAMGFVARVPTDAEMPPSGESNFAIVSVPFDLFDRFVAHVVANPRLFLFRALKDVWNFTSADNDGYDGAVGAALKKMRGA